MRTYKRRLPEGVKKAFGVNRGVKVKVKDQGKKCQKSK